MHEIKNKIIFLSALDWGLGHATRCVPIIRQLLHHNNKVIIGVTPGTSGIFTQEFPGLEKINVPAYGIKYSRFLPLWLKLLSDAKRISGIIKSEKKLLETIISTHHVEVVISDSRFGMHSKDAHCIFITHQVFLKTPFAGKIAQGINKKYLLYFDQVWVPDYKEMAHSLSGELSHGKHYHPQVSFIGPQSRLQKIDTSQKQYDYLFLISGPEPQSTFLKNLLIEKSTHFPELKFALVSPSSEPVHSANLACFFSPDALTLAGLIVGSKKIICRSGYSTLMDLHALGKFDLILVPTPGQTEQEYLAARWQHLFSCTVVQQHQLAAHPVFETTNQKAVRV